jgi:hypothetical protein
MAVSIHLIRDAITPHQKADTILCFRLNGTVIKLIGTIGNNDGWRLRTLCTGDRGSDQSTCG